MDIRTFLGQLNLTSYEKEVLVYLSTKQQASATHICKQTRVPQGRIYYVLEQLKNKKFVTVTPTKPKLYSVDDIKEKLTTYLEHGRDLLKDKVNQVKDIALMPKEFIQNNDPSIKLFTGRDEHLNALSQFRNSAKDSIIQMAPLFVGSFSSNLSLVKALERGVKIKILIKNLTEKNRKNVERCLAKCLPQNKLIDL